MLLAARVVAGVGAAMIMPVTLSVITSSFPAEQRARAVGIWSGFAGAGGILGLFVSSFLIDYFTWPWLFAMPVLFAGVSLVLTLRFVGNSREDHGGAFDVIGSLLSALAIGALVLGIHEGPERGWTDGLALTGLAIGVLALVAFVVWELRHDPSAAGDPPVRRPLVGRRFTDAADPVRRALRDLPRAGAVLPGRARILRAAGCGRTAAAGDRDDAVVGGRADDRQAHRRPPRAHRRHRPVRHRAGAARPDGVGRGRLLVGACPVWSCSPSASVWR